MVEESTKNILKKDVILYLIFGGLTTITNLGSFWIMKNLLNWDENISNFIAIIIAVLLAYFTNKDLVFHANAITLKERINQFLKFIVGRAFTMMIELIGGYLLFKLPIPNILSKVILTIIVVILNFFISKFFAFYKNN